MDYEQFLSSLGGEGEQNEFLAELSRHVLVPTLEGLVNDAPRLGKGDVSFVGCYAQAAYGSPHDMFFPFAIVQSPDQLASPLPQFQGMCVESGVEEHPFKLAHFVGTLDGRDVSFAKSYQPIPEEIELKANPNVIMYRGTREGAHYAGRWTFKSTRKEMESSGTFILQRYAPAGTTCILAF